MSATTDTIIDVADGLIRTRGFQGFAFREIAQAVGIKSASVHYHFPTKGDLTQAVMDRYAQRFAEALQHLDETEADGYRRLRGYIDMFRREMQHGNTLPVCMMLGADIAVLPESVVGSLQGFYDMNLSWLSRQLREVAGDDTDAIQSQPASLILACLHGALLGARSLNDHHYFEAVVMELSQSLGLD